MVKFDSKKANARALEYFPQWMDVNKRPRKSVGGKYLSSVTDENDEIEKAFEEFKDGFFLKRYAGIENDILSYVYIAHVGDLDNIVPVGNTVITDDPHKFLEDPSAVALYQDGYVMFAEEGDGTFEYEHNGFRHKINLKKKPLWNVFDEFALFSGLERYEGETNLQLADRIYAAYRRPQSPTEEGLKNAIINAVMNYDNLDPEDIKFERPNADNMFLKDSSGEIVYEKLSALNKDIARKKVWNKSYWENDFKKVEYLDNKWDVPLDVYQKGTGQGDDLKVKLSGSDAESDTTDISVMGYKTSTKLINDYVRKQGIKKDISLTLRKYRDELVERNVEYRIVATPAKEISPDTINVTARQKLDGKLTCYLENIMEDPGANTEIAHGAIDINTPYTLEFTAKEAFGVMSVNSCDVIHDDGTVTPLLKETGAFKFVNGILQNTDVKAHADKLTLLDESKNLIDVVGGGLTIGADSNRGSFVMDVSDMQGMPVTIPVECQQTNYTNDSNFVTYDGSFELVSATEIMAAGTDSESKVVIDMDCASLHYELGGDQGCATVEFELDGDLDVDKSGFFTKPEVFDYDFQTNHHVRITITKAGMYPLAVKNIMAARYVLTCSVDSGELIHTAKYVKLPVVSKNKLRISIESLSGYTPVIKYIHVGPSLERAIYRIRNFSIKKNGRLSIDSNCHIKLYKDGQLASDNYSTRTSYRNDTNHNTSLVLNVNNFLSIKDSSKVIESIAYRGTKRGAITLKPGEEIESVEIVGQVLKDKLSTSLRNFLNVQPDEKIYVAGNAHGFIVTDVNGNTSLVKCGRSMFPYETDQVEFDGLPKGTKAAFVMDDAKGVENISNIAETGSFEYAYIKNTDAKDYVAYNSVSMMQSPVDNVAIVNTFSPTVNLNTLMFYRIMEVNTEGTKASAQFSYVGANGMTFRDWALGSNHDGIHVEYDFSFGNTDAYQLDFDSIDETFSLSNNIKLKDTYERKGETYDLARYLVTPPDDMKISYRGETVQEKIQVAVDGFNKLWYSNIQEILSVEINGNTVPEDRYKLIEDAGIIVWRNMTEEIGSNVDIIYRYSRPDSLEFKDLSSLYELVGYSVDAYEPMLERPMIIKNLRHGDSRDIVIGGVKPDRIIIRCSNDNFRAVIDKARVTVQRQSGSSAVMVHSGYYYDQDKEYYLFEHDFNEEANQMKNVELERIQKNSGSLSGIQESGNYLLDTNMNNGKFLEKMCYIDCHDHQERIEGISDVRAITACESYPQWHDFNMDVKLVPGLNGLGLQFHSNGVGAYALLNISDQVEEGSYLTFYADISLKAYIMREVYADDDSMRKSIYCEMLDECIVSGSIRSYKFENVDERRLYLCVSGDGVIDDIVIRKDLDKEPYLENVHSKSISVIGFDIKENIPRATTIPINFTAEGNQFDGLEISDGGVLETGSTVDWGVTKLEDFKDSIERTVCYKVNQRKGAFYTGGERGSIKTPWKYLPNISSADVIFVKINDVLLKELSDFDIRVFTAGDMYGHGTKEIFYQRKANLVSIPAAALSAYVQIVVEMPPARVINSIEIYARYVEKKNQTLHVSESLQGTMTSKVYDLVTASNYRLGRIDADSVTHPENIHVMIRGLRQDGDHAVWTSWYPCEMDNELNCVSSHDFYDYRFFQFKIEISDMDASAKINNFLFEVI